MGKQITIDDQVSRIRILSRSHYPYLYGLVQGVKIKECEGIRKAYTDGRSVYMSKDIIRDRANNYKIYLHELMHIALMHTKRMELIGVKNNRILYNILADHRINRMLEEKIGVITDGIYQLDNYGLGKDLTYEEMHNYNEFNVDYLYYKITSKNGKTKDMSKYENLVDMEVGQDRSGEDSIEEKGFSEGEIREMIGKGIVYARSIGAGKGTFETILESEYNNNVDWKRIIKNNLYAICKKKFNYNKIHRKSILSCYPIMPSKKYKEGVNVVLGIDTSGSMVDEDIIKFIGSVMSLVRRYNARCDVIQSDYELQDTKKIKTINELRKMRIKGRGGTSFKPFIDYINKERPRIAVIFTDGFGDQENLDYIGKCNVFWIITKGGQIEGFKFGKVFEMKK